MLDLLLEDLTSGFQSVPWQVAALRLVAALVLGAAIGMERQLRAKAAGLRTHILVSSAACVFTLISFELAQFGAAQPDQIRIDPLRLIQAVTAGVAFLAAGTIIVNHDRVKGLTTGASMWMAGAIGLACGTGNIQLAGMATGLTLMVLIVLRIIEHRGPDE